MSTYLYLYLIIFISVLNKLRLTPSFKKIVNFLITIIFILVFGLRDKVGGDWNAYLNIYEGLSFDNMLFYMLSWDPGYVAVEYISKIFGFGIYGVNVVCVTIFFMGFLKLINTFSIELKYALLISFPYLILVVMNGYVRQAVAIGLLMYFISSIYRKEYVRSFVSLLFAITFHKTALIGIVILFNDISIKKHKILILFFILAIIVSIVLFGNSFIVMYKSYFVNKDYQSYGALIRIFINTIPSVLLIFFRKKWEYLYHDYKFWKLFAYVTFAMFGLALFLNISTIADRLLLYFYPLQIVVFYRLIALFFDNRSLKNFYFINLVILYWGILVMWLFFGKYTDTWIPYNNILLEYLL